MRCRRRGQARLRRRRAALGRIADADGGRDEAFVGIEADAGRLRLVARRQQRGAFRRGLQRLGDHHRDRLVGVADPVVLQQIQPEHERIALGVRILRELAAGWRGSSPRRRRDESWPPARPGRSTRPRAMLLTASTACSMPGGWLSAA